MDLWQSLADDIWFLFRYFNEDEEQSSRNAILYKLIFDFTLPPPKYFGSECLKAASFFYNELQKHEADLKNSSESVFQFGKKLHSEKES